MTLAVVPLIDTAPFFSAELTSRKRVAHEIGRACEAIGFLCITGHSVPQPLIDEMATASRRSSDLLLADKQPHACTGMTTT